MSHTSRITGTKFLDPIAITAACSAKGLKAPTQETYQFYDGSYAEGLCVRLPNWRHPVVVQANGEITYDNYNGAWGSLSELETFQQEYQVQVAALQMGQEFQIFRNELPNGDVVLTMERW